MQELSEKIAEHLKPLQVELNGYKFKYTCSLGGVIIEIIEQNLAHDDFVPISTKLFYQKENGDKIELYVRVVQTTEISFDRLKEIFAKVEKSLWDFISSNSKGLLGLQI